jgi:TRAP-type C4-dicarboxylate transport system permease small subunit
VGAIDRLVRALALAGGALLAAMAALMTAEAVLRYGFNRPVLGAQDAFELASVVIVFFAVAYCGRADGHVAVDLFFARMGAGARRLADILVKAASLAIVGLLAWQAALRALAFDPGDATNLLQVPRWPFHAVIALGAGLYALVLAIELAALLRGRAPVAPLR